MRVAQSCSSSETDEWSPASEKSPCAICGSAAPPCSENQEASFLACAVRPSDWLLTNGSWLHPAPAAAAAPDELSQPAAPAEEPAFDACSSSTLAAAAS